MAGTVCKAVFGPATRYDAAFNIRRALRAALTPPHAPVALICPPDLLEEELEAVPERVAPPVLGALTAAMARRYARVLAKAKRPALIAAEDVHWNGASAALEKLARTFAAPVFVAPYTAVLPVSSRSRCYAGYLPPSRAQIAERLATYDLLFFVGGTGMRTTLYSEATLAQPKLWIGNHSDVLAADGEFLLASVADTSEALTAIARAGQPLIGKPRAFRTPQRSPVALPARQDQVFHPSRAVHALLAGFPDAIWIDESGLSTSDVRQWMRLPAGAYLINGSGGIGWGLAAAVGVAIGNPRRQVVAIIGDGSALYASEALWTAAHHSAKLLLVILANRRYATLNEAAGRLTGKALALFTIEPPVLDFSGLAALHGWRYRSAESEPELDAFLSALHGKVAANTLLELKLDPAVKPVTAARHF
jgi:benzoylformate decarboxylase